MRSLAQSLRRATDTGLKLPEILPVLTAAGIRPRRGQVTMVAGPPNGGKSLLALWYVLRCGRAALYISADTDSYTTLTRSAAVMTTDRVQDIEDALDTQAGEEHYEMVLAERAPHVRFCFEPSPTLDDIDLEIRAYEEVMGVPPEIIVVDNLMNVVAEHENEFAGMREISKALHHIARATGAGVLVLHHTSESEGKPMLPAARKAIMGKIAQLPEVILTVAMAGDVFRVACVKNRSGPHDPTGETYVTLHVVAERMNLYESRQEAAIVSARSEYS